jgi:hypothetical protein
MADQLPEFEISDKKGTTVVYTGSVGTSFTAVPAAPTGNDIQSFSVEADSENDITNTLSVSIDGGTTVLGILYPSGYLYQLVKGVTQTQIHIKGAAASCAYRIMINYEIIV